ncbi:MAG: hypothetical protein HC895_23670 [Leptolyngbyaceae cyanobacterium SM1_3_5]|nr:hypothetical protein [Leptolyngbyaceae cyanobacterium SM1_3_5]
MKEITSQVQEVLKKAKDTTDDHGGKKPFNFSLYHFVADDKSESNRLNVYPHSHGRLSMNAGRHELDARSVMSELTSDFSKTPNHYLGFAQRQDALASYESRMRL